MHRRICWSPPLEHRVPVIRAYEPAPGGVHGAGVEVEQPGLDVATFADTAFLGLEGDVSGAPVEPVTMRTEAR